MPLRWKVREFLDMHGVTPYRLMAATGLAQGTVYRLARNEATSVNTETLELVLVALRKLTGKKVELQDLLVFEEI
jgi:DNA-binding Xre family transcriptional regulator